MNSNPSSVQQFIFQLRSLLSFNKVNVPWHWGLLAALAVGLPMLFGAHFGHFDSSVLAALGGMVILYMPNTGILHRMTVLAVCSFGFSVCFTLGLTASLFPFLSPLILSIVTLLITIICRLYRVPPPGSFFFILITCIATVVPFQAEQLPAQIGVVTIGGMVACLLALIYGLLVGTHPAKTSVTPDEKHMAAIFLEAAVIAIFVGLSMLTAQLLQLHNAYWVPISCAAILQGATFRMIWHRNIHRIVGTVIGMFLAWGIFSLPLTPLQLALLAMLIQFMIESLVPRNYGLAVIFITPITVIFAEAGSLGTNPDNLITVRMIDILLGSVIGFIGGWVIHQTTLFTRLENKLKQHWKH
ncbi:FUSC family protein [Gynuella sp.]|uniref:FUSC family protein n=1 Tax=Gynuella sp. TaxID=2969146 RepID=UPI003D11BC9E